MKKDAKGIFVFEADDCNGFASFASGAMGFPQSREFHEIPWTNRKTNPRDHLARCRPFDGSLGTYFLVWRKGTVVMVRVQPKS